MTTTKIKILASLFSIALLGNSCQKIVHGYISDDIYYQVNPFDVQQGVTTVSAALVLNGSTAPLSVKLLSLTDSLGNDADSLLRTPYSIVTYKAPLLYTDTTLDQFNSKLNDSLVRPFNIAEIGGRLQFTSATSYVPTGRYNMDISVSNVNGERTIKNACQINIIPLSTTSTTGYFSYRTYDANGNLIMRTESDPSYSSFDITYSETPGTSQIILKFVDKNGIPFNPNKGEVTDFSNDPITTTYYPKLHYWAPYYAQKFTDSTIVQQLPNVTLSFPYFNLPNYGNATSTDGVRIDNKITGISGVASVQTVMYFSLLAPGTYNITYHLLKDIHK
ncbi:hypothetical protein [Rhizosphaericola mali]|uniref:DUF5007 domain-containing protein n=1 Tax=Rhizosphaericola mali TaxID=2545455 RepID=A0A5P2GC32_9BACT|nr:hypothetical protein [Rhizosphaericola mali]QES89121.1 hypothetical protein E0W69_010775 [Rhizosphaericola mali]